MNKVVILSIYVFCILLSTKAFAGNITAISTGNWTTNSTWSCNCQPTSSDNITIASGITVTATGPVILFLGPVITIIIDGTLVLNSGASLQVDSSDIIKINSGGKISSTGATGSVWSGVMPFFVPNGSSINGPSTINGGSLPITLLFFKGKNTGESVLLKWATSMERSLDFYSLERSLNGDEFSFIGKIRGSGNSTERVEYTYEDFEPFEGMSYYRLKAVDLDGTSETFSIIPVLFEPSVKSANVFPNPVTESEFNVRLNFRPEDGSHLILYDNKGCIVLQKTLDNEEQGYVVELSSILDKGLYYLSIVTKTVTLRSTIIIQ